MNKNSIVLFFVFVCFLVINAIWYITGLEEKEPVNALLSGNILVLSGNC